MKTAKEVARDAHLAWNGGHGDAHCWERIVDALEARFGPSEFWGPPRIAYFPIPPATPAEKRLADAIYARPPKQMSVEAWEALDALTKERQPRKRWEIYNCLGDPTGWYVRDTRSSDLSGGQWQKHQAQAVADTLNGLEP